MRKYGDEAEGRAVHHRHALGLQQLDGEILVAVDDLARRRGLADQRRRRTDRRRTRPPASGICRPLRLVQHRHDQVAALLEQPWRCGLMKSCGPFSASTAAHCEIEQASEVVWPARLAIALISGSGPAA